MHGGNWSKSMVYDIMKRYAVMEGVYPGIKFIAPGGLVLIEPVSFSDATMQEAKGLCDTINKYADENNFWLWEYTPDGEKYKSIGGRTLKEMQQYYPGLN
jgi:hypothetical protein